MTWTPHDASRENVEAFFIDVRAHMLATGKPFGKSAAAVFKDAGRVVPVRVVREALVAQSVDDLV